MEIREFAQRVLTSNSIAEKLRPIEPPLTDDLPGDAFRPTRPARSSELQFCGRQQSPPMPHPNALSDPLKRAAAHHILANHELQALEVMAFVLCAFPDASPEFRREMIPILADEQRHTRMHIQRMEELGLKFGDLPVNGYFWMKAQKFTCLLDYLAGMPLTFEGRNLDHTLEFEQHFLSAGDQTGANVMRIIHRDEIRHVAFGVRWLRQLKSPGQTDWQAYKSHLQWPLRPEKSKGKRFHREPRTAAGMSDDFLDHLEQA